MAQLKAGDKAPDFGLLDQDGKQVALKDFRGRKLLLYFYPRADTPGCTKQACAVRDAGDDLANVGAAVVGVSPDMPDAQKKFDRKHNLGFALLSDPRQETAKAYGVWGEKVFMGRRSMGIIRSSFLIDEKSRIVQAWYKISPDDTVPRAQEALAGM